MQNVSSIELSRDCEAVQIPAGTVVTLAKGTPVDITQTLGGTYTVHASGGLFRIATKDADALGLEPSALGVDGEGAAERVRDVHRRALGQCDHGPGGDLHRVAITGEID